MIHHSDRRLQYCSNRYQKLLDFKQYKVKYHRNKAAFYFEFVMKNHCVLFLSVMALTKTLFLDKRLATPSAM